jgi:uncharacterized membrane protein
VPNANVFAPTSTIAPTWSERILGAVAYLAGLVPPLFLLPLLVYRWQRSASRFVGLHAVQAFMLPFALLLLDFALIAAMFAGMWCTNNPTLAEAIFKTGLIVLFVMSPGGVALLMPIAPLSGRPAMLPVLERWAVRILDAPPGKVEEPVDRSLTYTAQQPWDRLLAGAAYLSMGSPGVYILGPLVVFLWKRKSSRFVAFHALQALLLHVALVPTFLFMYYVVPITLAVAEWSHSGFFLGPVIAITLPSVVLWRGFAAMLGKPDAVPLFGRIARWVSARKEHDRRQPPALPGPMSR